VNPSNGHEGAPGPDAGGPSPEAEVLDLRVLEEMGILPGSGPGSLPSEIITIFLREEEPRVEQLGRNLAGRNGPDLAQAAHNVAGSCAILGARQVQAAAIALELAARAEDWAGAAIHLVALQGAWLRLQGALDRYRGP
jgi:HPt (histidine-containing phosphotransfer) domain-containing protein